jgi:hypothetical protein
VESATEAIAPPICPRRSERSTLPPTISAPFNICPNEINLHIIDFACSDGGISAHALCLVSKDFNSIASPLIWRSVSVSGVKRLRNFAARIEENPSLATLVEDIFICDSPNGKVDISDLLITDLLNRVWQANGALICRVPLRALRTGS